MPEKVRRRLTITDRMYMGLACAMLRPSKRPGLSPPRVRSVEKISVALRAVVLHQIERFRSRSLGDVQRTSINAYETTNVVDAWNLP
jgi:hypothetical protein